MGGMWDGGIIYSQKILPPKRSNARAVFLIVPLFDCDGAALGRAVHPFLEQGPGVYWTETWPETTHTLFTNSANSNHFYSNGKTAAVMFI